MVEKKISFEAAYEKLEAAAKAISSDEVPLEEAIENYKTGKKYYDMCRSILDEAKQLIEVYDRESGTTIKEM